MDRNQDYVYETVYDPTDHPEWRVKLFRPEGVYYSPDLESWALYFKGPNGKEIDLTPGAAQLVTGINQGLWDMPACQVSAN